MNFGFVQLLIDLNKSLPMPVALNSVCNILQLAAWLSGEDVGLRPADFSCPAPDLWFTADHFLAKNVHYGSANSAFHPSRAGKWVVIHVADWATWLPAKVRDCGLGGVIGCMPALSVMTDEYVAIMLPYN